MCDIRISPKKQKTRIKKHPQDCASQPLTPKNLEWPHARAGAPIGTVARVALLYSDGSFGVLKEGGTIEDALAEANYMNSREHNEDHKTRVADVRITVTLVHEGLTK